MKTKFLAIGLMCTMAMVGCSRDAQVASKNLSYAADNFELDRRIVFYNGITLYIGRTFDYCITYFQMVFFYQIIADIDYQYYVVAFFCIK